MRQFSIVLFSSDHEPQRPASAKRAADYDRELARLYQLHATNPTLANQQYDVIRRLANQRLSWILNDRQQERWRGMIGAEFPFSLEQLDPNRPPASIDLGMTLRNR